MQIFMIIIWIVECTLSPAHERRATGWRLPAPISWSATSSWLLEDILRSFTIFYLYTNFQGPTHPKTDERGLSHHLPIILSSPRGRMTVLARGRPSGDGQRLPSVRHGRPEGIEPLKDGLRLDLEQRLAVQGRDTTQMVHKPSGDDQRMPSGSHGRPEMAHAT